MKKLFLIILILVICGCCRTKEFWKHPTIWESERHAAYSLWGYKTWTDKEIKTTEPETQWWGCDDRLIVKEGE